MVKTWTVANFKERSDSIMADVHRLEKLDVIFSHAAAHISNRLSDVLTVKRRKTMADTMEVKWKATPYIVAGTKDPFIGMLKAVNILTTQHSCRPGCHTSALGSWHG